ncbi:hypothetical protein THIOKS12350089 [Thiocapsa sp. KS1]|nr:hypothetical protein THIOKS12350089 [Thiocapsa sp. KS1]
MKRVMHGMHCSESPPALALTNRLVSGRGSKVFILFLNRVRDEPLGEHRTAGTSKTSIFTRDAV